MTKSGSISLSGLEGRFWHCTNEQTRLKLYFQQKRDYHHRSPSSVIPSYSRSRCRSRDDEITKRPQSHSIDYYSQFDTTELFYNLSCRIVVLLPLRIGFHLKLLRGKIFSVGSIPQNFATFTPVISQSGIEFIIQLYISGSAQ